MNFAKLIFLVRLLFLNAYMKRSLLDKKSRFQNCKCQITELSDELAKIFVRFSDDYLLLDVEGAGTPEMANCCHGGCDNCAFSHIFDQLESGKPKWLATYSDRTLVDGRNHRFIVIFSSVSTSLK